MSRDVFIDLGKSPKMKRLISNNKIIYIPNKNKFDEDDATRNYLFREGIYSVLVVPINTNNELIGSIVLVNFSKELIISKVHYNSLQILANMVGQYFIKNKTEIERNKAQNKLKQALLDANSANKAKSEFLANMSHEIRTPLNGILGFATLIKNTALSNEQNRYIDNITMSGDALLTIINDILDFSKIEAGKLELELIFSDIIRLLENTIDMIKLLAYKKGIEVIFDLDLDIPRMVKIDATRLRQVMINLLNNAIKFTKNGFIKLKVVFKDFGNGSGRFHFYVIDTGIGISKDQIDSLFKKFSQADTSVTRKYGGSGLGLAISQNLVKLMGSEIKVKSRLGRGSIFYFSIITEFHRDDDNQFKNFTNIKNALLICNSNKYCSYLTKQLKKWNIKSNVVSKDLAFEIINSNNLPDITFINNNLFDDSGLELYNELRTKYNLKKCVLLCNNLEMVSPKISKYDILYILEKPVKRYELYEIIKQIDNPEYIPERKQVSQKKLHINNHRSVRILIVEDNRINMRLITKVLKNMLKQVEITTTINGKKAFDVACRTRFDLILMDIQMPVMGGIEACKLIKKDEASLNKTTPIVALTAGVLKSERDEYFEAGMVDILTKPLDNKKLYELLSKIVCTKK